MTALHGITTAILLAEEDFDPNTVTPGVIGFVATFLVMVAIVLLGFDLVRRVRRTRYREEIRERLAAEQQAAQQTADGAAGEIPNPEAASAPEAPASDGDDPVVRPDA